MLQWIYLPVTFNLQPAVASVSFQIDGTASQWLGNFEFCIGLPGILCLFTPRTASCSQHFTGSTSKQRTEVCVTYAVRPRDCSQEPGSCVAVHLCSLNPGLETRSVLKIKKHHQHSEKKEVCHSHCVCVYTVHKHSAHTGFIICQHFLEVPPPPVMCVPNQGLFLTLSWSHVCHFQDCSGWFLSSLLFPGCHKVKRDAYPHQQLSASLCRLV